MKIKESVELTQHNTFAVSSVARYFKEAVSEEQIVAAAEFARARSVPHLVIGEGSNLLFVGDYPGLVTRIGLRGIGIEHDSCMVTLAAGENWHKAVQYCLAQGLQGLENLALIPGTAGAAPVQNIGAYGVEIASMVKEVRALSMESGEVRLFGPAQCQFGYRTSVFKKQAGRWVILGLQLKLHETGPLALDYPGLKEELGNPATAVTASDVFDAVCRIRRRKLPDPALLPNAGSFFKNPVIAEAEYRELLNNWPGLPGFGGREDGKIKVPAGWILDKLGWRGRTVGQAAVHDQHALVLVNKGLGCGNDLLALACEMVCDVEEHFGLTLEPEVRIIKDGRLLSGLEPG